jgi:hypothetical protein
MKQLPILCTALFIIVSVASSGICRDRDWDSIPPRHNRIQVDPLSVLGGTVGGNYEYRVDRHHAIALEGYYTFPLFGSKGYVAGGMYRYYYKQNTFIGLFAKKGYQSSSLPSPERGDTTTYTFDLSYLSIGPDWGKSWYLLGRFPITVRAGIGLPIQSEFSWKDGTAYPANPELLETLFRISTILDAELTIGVSF